MIKAIVFDFGNVFINLDIEHALKKMQESLGIETFTEDLIAVNSLYEQGLISTDEFINFYAEHFPNCSKEELIALWNLMLKNFPKHRLEFLQELKSTPKYKLILLSNTNELHIDWIKDNVPFYNDFKNCFDAFYLSHEIQLRKPNRNIFEFVLNENNLEPSECFFIDDNEDNIKAADSLGFKTWHIDPKTQDVANQFTNHIID